MDVFPPGKALGGLGGFTLIQKQKPPKPPKLVPRGFNESTIHLQVQFNNYLTIYKQKQLKIWKV